MRDINLAVIHCSDTYAMQDIGASKIREWHVKGRGWSDIGYHYVIQRGGLIEVGRPIGIAGAHARGFNSRSVGVCMVGGRGQDGQPSNNFTDEQWASLDKLRLQLMADFPSIEFKGHRDLPDVKKACPCFDIAEWLP